MPAQKPWPIPSRPRRRSSMSSLSSAKNRSFDHLFATYMAEVRANETDVEPAVRTHRQGPRRLRLTKISTGRISFRSTSATEWRKVSFISAGSAQQVTVFNAACALTSTAHKTRQLLPFSACPAGDPGTIRALPTSSCSEPAARICLQ